MRLPYFAVIGALVVLAAAVGALVDRGGADAVPRVPIPTPPGKAGEGVKAVPDPFAYDPKRRAEFEQRAAAGNAHVLYSHSPGGATATAERVAHWRPQVETAARAAGVDADMVEALVFLESAGREDAVTPGGLEGAAGLTQILAETATNLLGLKVDVARSARYRRRIDRAFRRADLIRVQRLRAARARVDERFDPAKALAATGRYLKLGMDRFGVQELALVSYHMGMGNLEGVLAAYGGGARVPYAQVYFDSSPLRHPETHAKLAALGDDSSNYLWKLYAARDIMRLYRSEPEKLAETQALQTAKNSAEELLHPAGTEKVFATSDDLRAAYDAGDVVALPDDPPKTGLRVDRRMGELVSAADRKLYRGLRSPALALALYIGAQTRAMAGDDASTLTVSSTVRDERYQRLLIRRNREATRNYSLHTTGWAFDVLRRYRSRKHALAFQFVLDRLQSLNLIAWVREPGAIHITAARDAEALAPLLEAIQRGG